MERPNEPSTMHLVSSLVEQSGTLVRQELALARKEVEVAAMSALASGSLVLVGAGVGLVALAGLGAAVAFLLGMVVPAWAACLMVAAVLAAIAVSLVSSGVARLRALELVPTRTVDGARRLHPAEPEDPEKVAVRGGVS